MEAFSNKSEKSVSGIRKIGYKFEMIIRLSN